MRIVITEKKNDRILCGRPSIHEQNDENVCFASCRMFVKTDLRGEKTERQKADNPM